MSQMVLQAYRFALDPTPAQQRRLAAHAGAARFAFNWALAAVKANVGQRAAERSYGIADDALTPALGWSLPALRRAFNQAKAEVAPWWAECSKEAFDRKHITLPRLGAIKTHESTRKLARRIEAGTARILSATVRLHGGRWFCAFTVEVHRAARAPARPQAVVGVDLGITHLAVLSTGQTVPNPRHLGRAQRALRSAARTLSRRMGPDRRTGQRASARWQRAKANLGRRHARVANLRRDGLHKLTTRFTREYGTVVVEDLNLAQLVTSTTGTGVAGDPTPNGVNGRRADQKTTLVVAGGCEASTPHRTTGQDGDRSPVTASCG